MINYLIFNVKVLRSYPQMGSVGMGKKDELEQKLIKLKLEKRELVLAGKNTSRIDELIKEVEVALKEVNEFCNSENI